MQLFSVLLTTPWFSLKSRGGLPGAAEEADDVGEDVEEREDAEADDDGHDVRGFQRVPHLQPRVHAEGVPGSEPTLNPVSKEYMWSKTPVLFTSK